MRTPSQSQQDPRPKCPTCLLATAPPFRWNQDHCLQMQATKKASNRKPLIQQSNGERCTWSHQSKAAKILRETARRKPKEAIQNTHRHCKDRKDTAVGKRCGGRQTKGQRTRTLSNGHLYAPFYISFCFTAIFSAINKDDGCIGRP